MSRLASRARAFLGKASALAAICFCATAVMQIKMRQMPDRSSRKPSLVNALFHASPLFIADIVARAESFVGTCGLHMNFSIRARSNLKGCSPRIDDFPVGI